MSSKRWMCGLAAAVVMMTAAGRASAEPPDPEWIARKDRAVVVEAQDGSLVAGKLVGVEEGSVAVLKPDGSRAVVERSAIKAVRTQLRGDQVTVTMKENDATSSGKLAESDAKTIVVETDDGRRVTLDRASIKTVRERFPKGPAAAPPAASGVRGGDRAGQPKEPVVAREEEPTFVNDSKKDSIRIRGGLGFGGGLMLVSSSSASALGRALSFSARLGAQIYHVFSLTYQNSGNVVFDDGGAVFLDFNSLLANVTLEHVFDLGAGPSVDVLSVSNGSHSATAALPGVHGRLAYNIGGSKGPGPRRSGISIGVDTHYTVAPNGSFFTLTSGIGYEWF